MARKKKSPEKKYKSIDDVRCPICNGVINSKWFNFRTGQVVEFIAECWSGNINDKYEDGPKPRHIFYFQIETPECVLVCDKDSEVFNDD